MMCGHQWNKIDAKLARNDFDREDGACEMMENGWMRMRDGKRLQSPFRPFPRGSKALGPKDF